MRVGRYGDPGRRFCMQGLPLIDEKLAAALTKRLFSFAKAH